MCVFILIPYRSVLALLDTHSRSYLSRLLMYTSQAAAHTYICRACNISHVPIEMPPHVLFAPLLLEGLPKPSKQTCCLEMISTCSLFLSFSFSLTTLSFSLTSFLINLIFLLINFNSFSDLIIIFNDIFITKKECKRLYNTIIF